MIRAVFIAGAAVVLAACNAPPSQASRTGAAGASTTQATATGHMQAGPSQPARPVLDAMPEFNGIGPLRFGMTATQMRTAWGLPLYGEAPANDPSACHYLSPRQDAHDLLFMLEGNHFVRIDVSAAGKTAPGGGRVGMTLRQIDTLYAGHVTGSPGKYDAAARVLSVDPPHGGNAKLIFEIDAVGNVKAWRIGVPPQIDYVEGCG